MPVAGKANDKKVTRAKKTRKMKFESETVPIADLHPHPRNYRVHLPDQLEHIIVSIRTHGIYRNVVVAKDYTILAGHGVVEAATAMGFDEIPVIRINLKPDDPRALKILTGDNEISHLADVDDRQLTELLKEIRNTDLSGLEGTGYDDMMVAALAYVTRPASEIADFEAATHWLGMPEFEHGAVLPKSKIVVSFRSQGDRESFAHKLGVKITDATDSIWWPLRSDDDWPSMSADVRFVEEQQE